MPVIIRIKNYYIYFTLKYLKEPIHIHFHVDAPKDDGKSAKLWILSNGTLDIEHLGIFENRGMQSIFNKLYEIATENIDKAEMKWLEKKGSIEYIDVVGKFNVKQND